MKQKPRSEANKQRHIGSLIGVVLLTALVGVSAVLFFSAHWLSDVFPDLLLDELVYHMKAPLAGTSPEMITYYLVHYGIPEVLVTAAVCALLILSRREGRPLRRFRLPIVLLSALLAIAGAVGAALHMENRFGLISYLDAQRHPDGFIEENYVDPSKTALAFPEQKRNLIYIYLESAEITFADQRHGGAFEKNCIPELTELALENECFNGGGRQLNGGVSLPGTVWTMGAIFGHSTGLPLKVAINGNDMATQGSFFSSVTALGDILEDEGYVNEFLIGSNGEFGGRKLYFDDHGSFHMLDYDYAKEQEWIPKQYKVWWGYEDEKLFSFARDRLTALAAGSEPFNLTLLTVDTHFEDGYVCDLCGEEFGDDQYANVFACSSRQVTAFVRWIQQQDFYENTTIVLAGDHPTMDADFCDDVPADYMRRVYTAVINAAPQAHSPQTAREFSTFDLFPTTLAALGVQISGERLGLGTNLYSDQQTLLERFGVKECAGRMGKRSELIEELARIHVTDELVRLLSDRASLTLSEESELPAFHAQEKYDCRQVEEIRGIEVEYWNAQKPEGKHRHVMLSRYSREFGHYADLTVRKIPLRDLEAVMQVVLKDGSTIPICALHGKMYTGSLTDYLSALQGQDYLVMIAAKDDAATSLDDETAALLQQLGARTDLRGRFRAGYVLVADASGRRTTPIREALSDHGTLHVSGRVDNVSYEIKSSGFADANVAMIRVNGVNRAVNTRGLNIVVYDRTLDRVIDSICFDTFDPEHPGHRKN